VCFSETVVEAYIAIKNRPCPTANSDSAVKVAATPKDSLDKNSMSNSMSPSKTRGIVTKSILSVDQPHRAKEKEPNG